MTETAKHTPGPWQISGISMNDGSISIRHAEHRIVIAYATNAASLGDFVFAALNGRRDFGAPDTAATQWANARLIAAAPEMKDALRRVTDHLEEWARYHSDERTAEIDAAIFCARQVLTRADDKPTNADSDDAGCVRDF